MKFMKSLKNLNKESEQFNYPEWLNTIEEEPDLDGAGKLLAPVFFELLHDRRVNTIYEWCCGPAWIGLWLLEHGICQELVVSDINRKAIDCVRRTISNHNYSVRSYVSDNLKDIPESEKFDIIVANPPNYVNIQEDHPLGHLRYDLRPSDIDWKIHKNFYENIGKHMNKKSRIYISEVELYKKEVLFLGELYDKREVEPIKDFQNMISENNLCLQNVETFTLYQKNDLPIELSILDISLNNRE
tara:strand:- start:5034 stop:5762 length:729 start_codon:yes stop_codon:yes gene_type:complete